ncbi:MAG: (2Fe-2S) ferredoxin domain-containing protein, partial [Deltaproteobacteria bacterium]|nr:(2Fe-2S) ferredoxin domain-containing protein [Deltaproteobacteria bacterium]
MAKLTSVAELMKLQADSKAKAAAKKDKIVVNVSLATCSIASGGKVVLEAMKDEATKLGISNVEYMQSGCMTYCHSEPTVVVTLPGKDPVCFGKLDETGARELVQKYLKSGEVTG